jgi:GNAT superfamily N-acetyltransferase
VSEAVRIAPVAGPELAAWLPELARLRIEVFRAFPYLYDGSPAYEEGYLRTYAETPGAVIVGASVAGRPIGAATGLPLAGEPAHVTAPLVAAGFDISRLFYFGESVLEPAWRGKGIGVRFMAEREAWAEGLGFEHAVFCAVERSADHPRRPPGYLPLDAFWRRRGFAPIPGLLCHFSWQDLDETAATPKPMRYWIKRLQPASPFPRQPAAPSV